MPTNQRTIAAIAMCVVALAFASCSTDRKSDTEARVQTSTSAPEIALEPVILPGLDIALPAWSRSAFESEAVEGRIQLEAPNKSEQHIEVAWKIADAPSERFYEQILVERGLVLREQGRTRVEDRPISWRHFADDATFRHVTISHWACQDDPRTFTLLCSSQLDGADALRLHERILASMRCTDLPELSFVPGFPILDGDELTRVEHPTGVGYVTSEGETYLFTAGSPNLALVEAMRSNADLRRTMIRGMELDPAAEAFAGDPTMVGGRPVYAGRVHDPAEGVAFTMFMTAFACNEHAFIGMVLPASDQPTPAALERLGSVRCDAPLTEASASEAPAR